MPLYEYQCESCGQTFEKIQKFSDPREETCPACGGAVKKLVSSPAIQFKGSGWYITDYAKKSSTDGGTATKEGGAADKKDTGTTSEKSESPAPSTTNTSTSGDSTKKD